MVQDLVSNSTRFQPFGIRRVSRRVCSRPNEYGPILGLCVRGRQFGSGSGCRDLGCQIVKRSHRNTIQSQSESAPNYSLQDYYRIGESRYKPSYLAKEHKITEDHARKALKFAELFTPEDLAACYPRGVGKALTWTHVRNLVSVEDAAVRRRLIRAAVVGGWTVSRLGKEIKIAAGTSTTRRLGRRATPAPTIELALLELQQLSEKWMEYWNASKEALGLHEDKPFLKAQGASRPAKGTTNCGLTSEQLRSIRGVFGQHRKALMHPLSIVLQLDPEHLARVRAKSRKTSK